VNAFASLLEANLALDTLATGAGQTYAPAVNRVRIDRTAWLQHMATLRERAQPFVDAELGLAATPVTDAVNAIVRLGEKAPRIPFTSSLWIHQMDYLDLSLKLVEHAGELEERRMKALTEQVDLATAPPLGMLADRVAQEGRRFEILRDGRCVARLLVPPIDPPA